MHPINNAQRRVAIAILLTCASLAHADNPPADLKTRVAQQTKEAGASVKQDAQTVGAAVRNGANKVGVAAKEVGLEVADAAKRGAHEVAVAAKTGVEKTKAAVSGDHARAKPANPSKTKPAP
jgi:hypothetical protein